MKDGQNPGWVSPGRSLTQDDRDEQDNNAVRDPYSNDLINLNNELNDLMAFECSVEFTEICRVYTEKVKEDISKIKDLKEDNRSDSLARKEQEMQTRNTMALAAQDLKILEMIKDIHEQGISDQEKERRKQTLKDALENIKRLQELYQSLQNLMQERYSLLEKACDFTLTGTLDFSKIPSEFLIDPAMKGTKIEININGKELIRKIAAVMESDSLQGKLDPDQLKREEAAISKVVWDEIRNAASPCVPQKHKSGYLAQPELIALHDQYQRQAKDKIAEVCRNNKDLAANAARIIKAASDIKKIEIDIVGEKNTHKQYESKKTAASTKKSSQPSVFTHQTSSNDSPSPSTFRKRQ